MPEKPVVVGQVMTYINIFPLNQLQKIVLEIHVGVSS